jgi:hypothetical protein
MNTRPPNRNLWLGTQDRWSVGLKWESFMMLSYSE